jgi:autotransporter-like protein
LAPVEEATLLLNQNFANRMMSCGFIGRFCEWGGISGSQINQARTPQTIGMTDAGTNIAYGMQRAAGTHGFSFGFGMSYDTLQLGLQNVGTTTGNRLQGGTFAAYTGSDGTTGMVGVTFGAANDGTVRDIAFPTPTSSASGRQQANYFGTHIRVTRPFVNSAMTVTPYMDLGFTRINMENDDEFGATYLDAHLAGHGDTYSALQAGVSIASHFGVNRTLVKPALDLGVTQWMGSVETIVTGRLEGAPAGVPTFSLPSRFDRTMFSATPSLTMTSKNSHFDVKLSGEYRVSDRLQGLTSSISAEFKL